MENISHSFNFTQINPLSVDHQETDMPSLAICPYFTNAYKQEKLEHYGIKNGGEYKAGNYYGNSSKGAEEIFLDVTHSLSDLLDRMKIGFPVNKNKEKSRTLTSETVVSREISYVKLGKCFEIDLAQFREPLQSVKFYFKMDGYVFVNMKGHFHSVDSYSKIEVLLNQCLFIDFTYEIMIQNEEKNCRKYNEKTYDICSEKAIEAELLSLYNCSVPFINSLAKPPVCTGIEKTKKVKLQIF